MHKLVLGEAGRIEQEKGNRLTKFQENKQVTILEHATIIVFTINELDQNSSFLYCSGQ